MVAKSPTNFIANSLTAFSPEFWAAKAQETFLKESIALGIANTELRADLTMGISVHKPYGSYPRVQTYTKGTAVTIKDISTTDEYLEVNTAKVAPFYVDELDKVQNKWDVASEWASIAGRQLSNVLDQAVIGEYTNAGTTLTGASIGEAAGGIVMSAANTANIFTAAGRVLNSKKRLGGERFALIGPRMLETIQQYVGGRETGFGDTVSDNGKVANRFGFGLRLSNNLPFTATLTTSVIPVAGDTITINGVVLTAAASGAATAAGEFSIGANAAAATANIVGIINDSLTPGATTYIALSAENRQLLEESGIVATDNTTNVGVVAYGDIVVSETITSATDVWSDQFQYALVGQVGSIDLVTQIAPTVVFKEVPDKLGKNVLPYTFYGKKTFERMKGNLVAIKFDVSSWVA
mgnify:CR=1 FL=1